MLYAKTEAGRAELSRRALPLSPMQRRVLILSDGLRHVEDLERIMPSVPVRPALEHLSSTGLIMRVDASPGQVDGDKDRMAATMSQAERYCALAELATLMAADLGFFARIKAQLEIEKAQSVGELAKVIRQLTKQLDKTPLTAARLNWSRQLSEAI